jgi:hypothetical protein
MSTATHVIVNHPMQWFAAAIVATSIALVLFAGTIGLVRLGGGAAGADLDRGGSALEQQGAYRAQRAGEIGAGSGASGATGAGYRDQRQGEFSGE